MLGFLIRRQARQLTVDYMDGSDISRRWAGFALYKGGVEFSGWPNTRRHLLLYFMAPFHLYPIPQIFLLIHLKHS